MINRQNFFDQTVWNNLRTYNNIQNIATVQGDDCPTDCLLYYNYFDNYYKMIAIDVSKQKPLNADPKAVKHIQFYYKSRSRWKHNNVFLLLKKRKKPF